MKSSTCAVIIATFCVLNGFTKAEQPYTVKNENVEHFGGTRETAFCMDDFKIVGRQRFINGTAKFTTDMASDHFKIQAELFSSPQGDDQWKRLPMGLPRTPICEAFKDIFSKLVQPSLIQGENTDFPHIPEDGLCPIPQGDYFVKNLELNPESWPNQIPRGLIKAVVTIFKDDISVGGVALIVRIEDRE